MTRMQRLLSLAAWGYLGCLLLLPLVWAWRGERQWLLALLRYSPALCYLIPLALLLGLGLVTKKPIPRLPLVASALVVLALYASPVLSLSSPGRGQLKVLTYNILAGRMQESDELTRFLKRQNCDLILLQEVYTAPFRADPLPPIQAALGDFHMVRGGEVGELVIFSRFPIRKWQEFELGYSRPGLWADVEMGEKVVRVYNVHYDHFDKLRTRGVRKLLRETAMARFKQTNQLEAELSRWDGPVILAGDFNSPPDSDTPTRLRTRLQDAFALSGRGLGQTFPSFFPLWRIDYVYASRHFAVRQASPVRVTWSDHRPVRAELDLL